MAARQKLEIPRTRDLGRGVRLHVVSTSRFTTAYARIVFSRDLGAEATATAILAEVLQSATERHPTREALAHRLDDLYGASLGVGVRKLGDRQLLSASLEWPTRGVGSRRRARARGLALLGDVVARPLRGPDGLDASVVALECSNHRRTLAALADDKSRRAMRRCLELGCRGEPYGLDALGRPADIEGVTPQGLALLHDRLLQRQPAEIFLVGDVSLDEACDDVRRHLLSFRRAPRTARLPPVGSVRAPRSRPRHGREADEVAQGRLVMLYRAPIRPSSPGLPAALTLAGVLGGPAGRLFKVVREEAGLCYRISGGWHAAKGLFLVEAGIDPAHERRARRLIGDLVREACAGTLDAHAHHAFLEGAEHGVAALADDRAGLVGWAQESLALGLPPSPRHHLAALHAVTPTEVRRVGRRLGLDATFFLAPIAGTSGVAS